MWHIGITHRSREFNRFRIAGLAAAVVLVLAGFASLASAQTASEHYEEGSRLFDQGDFQAAIRSFDKAIAGAPAAGQPYSSRGAARASLGQYKEALADLKRAIELEPELPEAYSNRAYVKIKVGDLKGSIADSSRAIELNPEFSDAYSNRAWAHSVANDHAKASIDATRAIELDPANARAYNIRGAAKYFSGDWQGALADYKLAIEADPTDAQFYNNRALALVEIGDTAGALAGFGKAIELDPNYSEAYSSRATTAYNRQEWAGSLKDFQRTIELAGREADTSYYRFYIWLIQARTADRKTANAALERYFVEQRKNGENDWEVAIASFLLGYTDETALLTRAEDKDELKARGQKAEAYFYIGSKYLIDGNRETAAQYFRKTLEMNMPTFLESKSAAAELKRLEAK